MQQLSRHEASRPRRIANIASVPHRSPFRYPGGKTWLIPEIRQWLRSQSVQPRRLIEPFAGGAIVGLTAAFENLVQNVVLVELDPGVASVWKAILGQDGSWLANQILDFELTAKAVNEVLKSKPGNVKEQAFHTILRNRTSHGGIMAPGSGTINQGENGRGISSRWYPETLAKRICDIVNLKDRIEILEQDGTKIIQSHLEDQQTVFFIDPPYTVAGKRAGRRLYTFHEVDHDELFSLCQLISGDFLMTYDNTEEVHRMAHRYGFDMEAISMKNTHHAELSELLIGRDLSWFRNGLTIDLFNQDCLMLASNARS
jgi:DNA adenine methylase